MKTKLADLKRLEEENKASKSTIEELKSKLMAQEAAISDWLDTISKMKKQVSEK
jgi:hypothetical protein